MGESARGCGSRALERRFPQCNMPSHLVDCRRPGCSGRRCRGGGKHGANGPGVFAPLCGRADGDNRCFAVQTQEKGASSSKEGVKQRKEGQFDEFWGGTVYQGGGAAGDKDGRGDATEEASYKLPEGPAFADEKAFERVRELGGHGVGGGGR